MPMLYYYEVRYIENQSKLTYKILYCILTICLLASKILY